MVARKLEKFYSTATATKKWMKALTNMKIFMSCEKVTRLCQMQKWGVTEDLHDGNLAPANSSVNATPAPVCRSIFRKQAPYTVRFHEGSAQKGCEMDDGLPEPW